MELRNSVESLKTLLDVSSTSSKQIPSGIKETASDLSPLKGDSATLSSAGSRIAESSSGSEVRTDKVASIQAAIASGTYHVPASAVAGKVVASMFGDGHLPEN